MGTKRHAQGGKHDLQQRVTELETALLSISQKLETTSGTTEPDNGAAKTLPQPRSRGLPFTPLTSSDSNSDAPLKHAPVFSLFDNPILSRQPDDSTIDDSDGVRSPISEVNNSASKLGSIRRALFSLFPSEERQEAILSSSYPWWSKWLDICPQVFGLGTSSNIVEFVADLKDSGSVQKIAKALLFLFIIQQEGPHHLNTSYGMTNAQSEASHALSIVDEMVLNDEGLAGTIDGIECIMLRANYESNCGRIRKAWLTYRRAISFAQLSGFHKNSTSQENDTSQSRRRDSLWKALYSSDRLLSLVLGLPYGPSEIHSDIGRDSEACAKGIQAQDTAEPYFYRLTHIVGHIIDRNQQLPSNNMLPLTFKIEAEMMELAASMPSDWWESGRESGPTEKRMFDQLLPQFWHHQARSLLHLPFMLKATTDRLFQYNKIAAVESAREMIARYRVIRPLHGFGSHICKIIDFQVFTAAMVLVLNLLDHYRRNETLDQSEANNDQDLISVTTDILQRASAETYGGVATQAARALEIFGNIKELPLPIGESEKECTTKVVIPYFGTVIFGPGTSLKSQGQMSKPKSTPYIQQLPTPSDQSLDGLNSESATPSNFLIEPTIPFSFNYGEDSEDMGVNSDFMANVNFDLDQDWDWFWNNIDIPSADLHGAVA